MQALELKATAELIVAARETCRKTREVIDELNRIRDEMQRTVSYYRWWRFLNYDERTIEFLDKLDMRH